MVAAEAADPAAAVASQQSADSGKRREKQWLAPTEVRRSTRVGSEFQCELPEFGSETTADFALFAQEEHEVRQRPAPERRAEEVSTAETAARK